ncbi:hypothetical protein QOT17_013620, partial [Balamuthia mandrillaris]
MSLFITGLIVRGSAQLRSFGCSSLGLLLFFPFRISPLTGKFWWNFFKHLTQGRFSSIFTSDKTSNPGKYSSRNKKSKLLIERRLKQQSLSSNGQERKNQGPGHRYSKVFPFVLGKRLDATLRPYLY